MAKHIHVHVGKTRDGVSEVNNAINKVKREAAGLSLARENSVFMKEELVSDLNSLISTIKEAIRRCDSLG